MNNNKKYKYTLTFESNNNFNSSDLEFETFGERHKFDLKQEELKDARVKYPKSGANSICSIEVIFTRKVSKDRAEKIIEYWNKIPYISGVEETNWQNNDLILYFNPKKSKSKDLDKRNILELLLDFLENGTMPKKDGTKTLEGLGENTVKEIGGFDYE